MSQKPHVSNAQARAAEQQPTEFVFNGQSYEIAAGSVVVYDDRETAEAIATHLGTYAKHSPPRFSNSHWSLFSIVKLP